MLAMNLGKCVKIMAAVSRGQGQFQFCQVNMSVYSLWTQGTGAPKLLVQRGLMGTFSTTCLSCGVGTSTSWTLPGTTLVLYLYTVGCWTATCLYTVGATT